MKANEIRDLSNNEIEAQITEMKAELFSLRFQLATGQLANNSRIREIRKTIARMKTIMHERTAE